LKYRVEKTIEIAGAHALDLDYDSPCTRKHGHNWMVTICCEANELDRNGMVVDFKHLKGIAYALDHQDLDKCGALAGIEGISGSANSSAELVGAWLMEAVNDWFACEDDPPRPSAKCVEVRVRESRDNLCIVTA
jgi:6-pyruvoyl-tetrahydropterin synthase